MAVVVSALFFLSILFPPTKLANSAMTAKWMAGWSLITEMKRDHVLNWGVLFLEWILLAGAVWLFLFLRKED